MKRVIVIGSPSCCLAGGSKSACWSEEGIVEAVWERKGNTHLPFEG